MLTFLPILGGSMRTVISCKGRLWFAWLLISCGALAVTASAQHFKQVTGTLTQVAAGRNEVFGIGTASQIYRYNPGTKAFVQIPGALAQVAVGGGTLSQKDEVWGVNPAGQIYHFNFGKKIFTQVPGTLAQIAVGEGRLDKCHTYEVWGINASDNIYRYNYCTKQFDFIPGSLSVIATGGGSTWGLDRGSQIYFYRFINGAFFDNVPGSLQQITTNGSDVWGIDSFGEAVRFNPASNTFQLYFNGPMSQLAVGGDGVWAVGPFQIGVPPTTFSFNEFDSIDNGLPVMAKIAVGYGAGVWGIDSSNRVYVFVRP